MKILAHRGYWLEEEEKNSLVSIKRAIENGYGFETDFRDYNNRIVISHNPPKGETINAEDIFRMYKELGCRMPIAIDIKADGLQDMIGELLEKYSIDDYFMVDMSVCDTVLYVKKKLSIASRSSEYEPYLPFYSESNVIWIDYFDGRESIEDEIRRYIHDKKIPCVVSPELHQLPYEKVWEKLKEMNLSSEWYLCTDFPQKAKMFFNQF